MKTRQLLLMTAASALLALPALAQTPPPANDAGAGKPPMMEGHGPMMGGEHRPMGVEKMDTDGDGKVSKAEWAAANDKKFDELDANHDGFIDKDELKAHREEMKDKMKDMKQKRDEWKEKHEGTAAPAPAAAPATTK